MCLDFLLTKSITDFIQLHSDWAKNWNRDSISECAYFVFLCPKSERMNTKIELYTIVIEFGGRESEIIMAHIHKKKLQKTTIENHIAMNKTAQCT